MARGKSITRERTIQKALEMARRDGIENVTYNQLARELGIRPQSLYRYVENIREVRVIIVRTFLNEMVDALKEKMAGKPPAEALYAFSEGLYDLTHQNPCYFESLEVVHRYGLLADIVETMDALLKLIEAPIEALKPEETGRYTQLFMAMNIGYMHMGVTRSFPKKLPDNREVYLKSVKELIEKIF